MFRFASPLFLFLLLVLPAAFYFKTKKGRRRNLRVSSLEFMDTPPVSLFVIVSRLLPFVKIIALALLIIAMARPQWGVKKTNVQTQGINIILALDLSESMAALDFKLEGSIVTRLSAVKSVVKDFIMKREGDRIGMVVFGSHAYTQIPLTRDYDTIAFLLDRLEIGAAGPSTAIGDAVGISLKRLEDIESKSNIIILLTDGKSNSGELSPMAAAQIAAKRGVKIYTIGVGQKGNAPFLVKDSLFGERYIYQRVDMDHETLKQIADKTQAHFFTAKDTQSLNAIYDSVDALEKTEVDVKIWAEYNELYFSFLISGFLMLGLYIILLNTRLLKVP